MKQLLLMKCAREVHVIIQRYCLQPLVLLTLLTTCTSCMDAQRLQMRYTYQSTPDTRPDGETKTVQAASTAQFIASIGVGTHFGAGYSSTPYRKNTAALIQLLINSGIRHIRDGGTWHDSDYRSMAAAGIRINFVMDPKVAIIPTAEYWCNTYGYSHCILITDYLKQLGPNVVDSVEGLNEIDAYYSGIRWHASMGDLITNTPGTPNYWMYYATAYTADTCNVLKNDPALSSITCLAPSLSGDTKTYFPESSFYAVANDGSIHPYPYGGNTKGTPILSYDGVPDYFRWTSSPDMMIDEYPWWVERVAAYTRSPDGNTNSLFTTETGYHTGTSSLSLPEDVQGKYVPRLFAEYFRHGFDRTFWYELIDEAANPADPESNFGLIHNDLTPKPGYVALQSLLALLQDSAPFNSPAGSLTYGVRAIPDGSTDRTQYVHDLLLQKSDGRFYLLLWHEISDVIIRNGAGMLTSADTEIFPPALKTTITLPPNITKATLYQYDDQWQLQPSSLPLRSHAVSIPAADSISIIELSSR